MGRVKEIQEKKHRVRAYLRDKDLDGVLLSRPDHFAWFTAGGRNSLTPSLENGVASLLITKDEQYCLTNNIECERIHTEELGEPYESVCFDWFDAKSRQATFADMLAGKKVASDVEIPGAVLLEDDFTQLRWSLTDQEIDKYTWLGRHTSEAVELVAKTLRQGDSESRVASELARALYAFSITPVLLLVAADERIQKCRHPVPTQKEIKKGVLLVVCALRWGLVVSMSRMVHFGPIQGELRIAIDAVAQINSVFNYHTRPGAPVKKIFNRGLEAYETVGFKDAWRYHHQGGPTGYRSREYIVTGEESHQVLEHQAYCWNPSINGIKSVDTIISTDQDSDLISGAIEWPMLDVEVNGNRYERPDILIR